MPTLKVYEAGDSPKVVTLKLEQDGSDIRLITLNGDGDEDNVLITFSANGSIKRYEGVDEDYGFTLDDDGRIKFEDED